MPPPKPPPPPPPDIAPIEAGATEFFEFSVGPEKEFVLQIDILRNIKTGHPVWYEGTLVWISMSIQETAEGASSATVLKELLTRLGKHLQANPAPSQR